MYILRTCKADMSSPSPDAKGFVWPNAGPVEAPNWTPGVAKCGNGLHGLPWGCGNNSMFLREPDAQWLVAAVNDPDVVKFDGKCVFPRAWVVFCGDQFDARLFLFDLLINQPIAETAASQRGDYGQASQRGDSGQASQRGYSGQASQRGDYGQASQSGYYGQASQRGYYGQASQSGYSGQASQRGDYGQASQSGDSGQASQRGDYGQASQRGDSGQASQSGDYGQAQVNGSFSLALSQGNNCRVCGTIGCALLLTWYDTQTIRVVTAYVGEGGIEPDVWYRLNDRHEFEKCE